MAIQATGTSAAEPLGLEAETVAQAFQSTASARPGEPAIRTRGDAERFTWSDYANRVRRAAAGLAALGVTRGETVGLMLTNRPEFHFADTGAMHLGAVPFSVYNTSSEEQITYLVSDAANSVIFTEQAFLDTVLSASAGVDSLRHVVVVDGEPRGGAISLDDLESRGEDGFDFEESWQSIRPDDLLTLIYTSGTTGPPKGVQLTHGNVMSSLRSFAELLSFPPEGRLISWLPMAHIAERNVGHYLPIAYGYPLTCCPDARQVAAYLTEVRPSTFFAVPRIWEKLKTAMEIGFGAEEDENRKKAIRWALEVGARRVAVEQAGEQMPEDLAAEHARAEVVLAKIRESVGLDQLETVNVGAAPTPPEVIEFFHALGVPISELWGLSETCGAGACNPPERIKIGTVGTALPGIELKIADDGEVLIRGPVVMVGYRNDPEKTAETIDEDGWLHTGDIGELDEDGYLRIVDRKKELIINSAGKNMSPANIEAKIKASSPLIGQVCVIGDDRPYNVALIVLDPDAAPAFAAEHGLEDASPEDLTSSKPVLDEVAAGVERGNSALARVEQVKKFKLLPTDWHPGGDELTPTMKLKRRPIESKYSDEIEALYAE